ncbi:MAG: ABC transporter permease [Mucilaginibacter sp.]|nr:ABC transporter permease [Mucilaginibacter sp.]
MNLIQTLPLLNQLAAISFRIGLLDLAWLGLVFTGSAFVLQLTMAGAYRGTANRFLALALSTVVLYALGLLILPAHSEAFTALLATTGPLVYFFVKKLIPQASALHWRDGMHLIPPVVAFCLPACSGSVVFAATAIYIELSLREIDGYHHRLEFTGGDRYRDELRWLYHSLRNFGRLWLLWLPFTLLDYFDGTRGSGIDGYLQFLFAVAFTRIAVTVCLKQTPGQRLLRRPAPTAQVSTRAAWLKAAMKSSRYYEDPDLSLNLLAGKLGLQPHELSRMINTTLKKNFNDFVNEYRVKAAAARMRDSAFDHLSLLGIAYESGFNSQSSFNRSFRQVTGKSPVAYKNSLKKELSNYDLGSRRPFEPLVLDQKPNYGRMFKHHFKTAWRNLKKNKVYTILNIAGLAVGTVCAALILLWVEDEVTFNHNFKKHNDLYHVMQNEKSDAGIHTNGSTPGPLAAALKNEVPGIVNSGRLSWAMDELVVYGDKTIKENGLYADPSILEMYGMDFIYGNRGTALNRPGDVVISETLAGKFFGDKDPVGRTIKMNINGSYSVDGVYTITGVFKDLPANCYYHFQWVSPYRTWEDANTWLKPWSNNLTETIVELSATASPASVNAKLKNYLGTKVDNAVNQLFLFSMNDWHLRANFVNGLPDGGTIKYVRLFTAIAMIILLIACINFMNLSTARSEQRAKEVGVLKVMGAGRTSLKMKFISESLMMSFLPCYRRSL